MSMRKMIVHRVGEMYGRLWQPGESFEFDGLKSTWFAPEGEEPKSTRPSADVSKADQKDAEIQRLKEEIAELKGKPAELPRAITHPEGAGVPPHRMAEQVSKNPSPPQSPHDRRLEEEEARNHQANNPTLTPEQRQNAAREASDRAFREEQEAAKKAEAEKQPKNTAKDDPKDKDQTFSGTVQGKLDKDKK